MSNKERVVLVVGACGLDRLLTVPKYPQADAKVRTTAYHEIGGGNAANSAAAIARLTDASFLRRDQALLVQYLGKVGQDEVGDKLLQELNDSNVDTWSPLCLRGPPGSTTSFTTIIVSEEEHTRTCIHTPGSCGELAVADCESVDMDAVFQNVVHLHSDARHTSASLYLAKQAKQRGVTVSCDCEKDRHTSHLDELLEISDIVFTNSGGLRDYLDRLTRQLEKDRGVIPLIPAKVDASTSTMDEQTIKTIADSLTPSAYLARWYPRLGRQVIVTQGNVGALHFTLNHIKSNYHEENCLTENTITITRSQEEENLWGGESGTKKSFCLKHRHNQSPKHYDDDDDDDDESRKGTCLLEAEYLIQSSGVMSDVLIVDTTGAGDAFIGGYLLAMLANDTSSSSSDDVVTPAASATAIGQERHASFAMNFGSWVAGNKLGGPGVRDALPRGKDVDDVLGSSRDEIDGNLKSLVGPFAASTV